MNKKDETHYSNKVKKSLKENPNLAEVPFKNEQEDTLKGKNVPLSDDLTFSFSEGSESIDFDFEDPFDELKEVSPVIDHTDSTADMSNDSTSLTEDLSMPEEKAGVINENTKSTVESNWENFDNNPFHPEVPDSSLTAEPDMMEKQAGVINENTKSTVESNWEHFDNNPFYPEVPDSSLTAGLDMMEKQAGVINPISIREEQKERWSKNKIDTKTHSNLYKIKTKNDKKKGAKKLAQLDPIDEKIVTNKETEDIEIAIQASLKDQVHKQITSKSEKDQDNIQKTDKEFDQETQMAILDSLRDQVAILKNKANKNKELLDKYTEAQETQMPTQAPAPKETLFSKFAKLAQRPRKSKNSNRKSQKRKKLIGFKKSNGIFG